MPSNIGGYDDSSTIIAEEFAPYVSDAVFIGNRVIKVEWDNARKHNEGRFLALPLLTNKNNTATSFGQYDTLPSGPQSIYSVASFPWSWYTAACTLDYITEALQNGMHVEFRDFGVFQVTLRKSRIGRNPNKPTNVVRIPPRKVVKFKPGRKMKLIMTEAAPAAQ